MTPECNSPLVTSASTLAAPKPVPALVKKRILFVDDEPSILQGLENILRKQRGRWDMFFAVGAEAALAHLREKTFDVIVSDMRMPGMDGAELLARVKVDYPNVVRLVLSGHAEKESVVRALPVAHQFLNKPCDAETLRLAIERTCDVHGLLESPNIRQLVGSIDRLPTAPRTYWELTQAVADPNIDLARLAGIVQQDPGMSVKLLQLVNSAYFGLAQRITSIHQAVVYLGIELLRGLALSTHVFGNLDWPDIEGFSMERFQIAALMSGKLARHIIKDPQRSEEAFTAALVHDIGLVVLASGFPKEYEELLKRMKTTGIGLPELEREHFGASHEHVGAYLLGSWGVPFSIVAAVAHHHHPSAAPPGPQDILAAVHVADALTTPVLWPDAGRIAERHLEIGFAERAGLKGDLGSWKEFLAVEMQKVQLP